MSKVPLDRAALWATVVFLAACSAVATKTPASSQERVAQHAAAAPAQQTPTSLPAGPLGELDQEFQKTYHARRAELKQDHRPVIVVSFSSVSLFRDGKKQKEGPTLPPLYHVLKAVDHLPFAIYIKLSPHDDSTLSQAVIDDLQALNQKVSAALPAVDDSGFSPEQASRARTILNESQGLLHVVIDEHRITRERLAAFAAQLGPLMRANADDAGCEQIKTTHAQVMQWKADLSADEWNSLLVSVPAKHQARYRNAAIQYFGWLLGATGPRWAYPGESMRVVFVEFLNCKEENKEDSRDLLATVEIDAGASQAFFGDAWRLSEDVLSDGAAKCIAQLPPLPPTSH